MPALEAQLSSLEACHTQAMGISVDSIYSHANFGSSLGGISYPLLADFHPKGAFADSLGVYMNDKGITMRATVIVDANGIVKYVELSEHRDMAALVKVCQEMDAAHGDLPTAKAAPGLSEATMYIRNNCGSSRAALLAKENLHFDSVVVKNVSTDDTQKAKLKELSGSETAPVLVVGSEVIKESAVIVEYLAGRGPSI